MVSWNSPSRGRASRYGSYRDGISGTRGVMMGVGLGPKASGAGSRWPNRRNPTLRVCNKRRCGKYSIFRMPHGRVGFPPTMNTGAALRFSCLAYQSACIATQHCEVEKFALTRSVGTNARAHSAPPAVIAQRAKVGYCPFCTVATHVAFPPAFAIGGFNTHKVRGQLLWEDGGP